MPSHKSVKRLLIDLHGCRCMLCGKHKCYEDITLHHIIPKRHYKRNNVEVNTSYENCALLCKKCHSHIINKYDYESRMYKFLTKLILFNKKRFTHKNE